MSRKIVFGILLTLLVTSLLTLTSNIQPVEADYVWTETIYIRADGSITPENAPIARVGNTYTLTDNIVGNVSTDLSAIIIQRNNIIVDGAGFRVEGSRAGQSRGIYLFGLTNVTIQNVTIRHFWFGIWLRKSSNNNVSRNNVTTNNWDGIRLDSSNSNSIYGNNVTTNNWAGIHLDRSSDNNISGNNMTNNGHCGIYLLYSSDNNVFGNNITETRSAWGFGGISLDESSHNIISRNNITNNDNGIWLRRSSGNIIYHNHFVNNTNQVGLINSTNTWNEGYPSGGNYWSDYSGVDLYSGPYQNETGSDGIGDTPYVIDDHNRDRYPLLAIATAPASFPIDLPMLSVLTAIVIVAVVAFFLVHRKKKPTKPPYLETLP